MKIPERAEVDARKENEKLTESRGQNNFFKTFDLLPEFCKRLKGLNIYVELNFMMLNRLRRLPSAGNSRNCVCR